MQTSLRRIAVSACSVMILSLLPSPAVLHAQTSRVERIDVFDAGIYCAETINKVSDPDAPGGHRNVVVNNKLMKRTTEIPALLGTRFGLRYTIAGAAAGAVASIRFMTRLPSPGLRDPVSGKTILVTDHTMITNVGATGYQEYHLEEAWEAVPGDWIFEFWHDNRKLAQQRFTLVAPQAAQQRNLSSAPCAPVVGSLPAPTTAASRWNSAHVFRLP